MGRRLGELSERFRPLAVELLARCVEAGIMVVIVSTGRTAAEQAEALRTGHSKVTRSKHQDGDAIDVVIVDQFMLHGPDKLLWSTDDPMWLRLGELGEAIGLRWGGRFSPVNVNGIGWDPGHFEFVDPAPSTLRV